ncbi:uncharacterized protein LOC129224791 [Uloborus diversus]|uniref:uncharacterized protein LOC129224791 n=1 Tax=Uloborus diversus TaxID=327109 RepID=UPI00240A846B|nr:uncharacterized protein LOC129224791 [Uloborus diversus]
MNFHLRVELQSLKRRLVGGYGFDLTRFCAGCWVQFGRITRRGYTCSVCKTKVCKTCRHFVGARYWICILCHRKKYCPNDSWHDDANLKKYKASQGKSGTYLLRLTDWSSRGVFDIHPLKNINTRRTYSFCEESLSKSSSLPCELPLTECHDYEFWNTGFVQCRVRRLEEDLSANWDNGYNLWNSNFEVQSLCSLELDRIRPDSDDYRIAYLSSTSQESSLDYVDDNFSSFGMGTLDVKVHKKYRLPEDEDWDLSISSNDEQDSSSEEDEFYFSGKDLANGNSHFVATSRSSTETNNFSNEPNNFSSSSTGKKCCDLSRASDDFAEACSSDNTKCKDTSSELFHKEEKTETGVNFCTSARKLSQFSRGFRSPPQLSQQSVPAVQRVSREREICLPTTADAAVTLHPTADCDRDSCRIDCGKWLTPGIELCFGYPLISDYRESERTALLDYCDTRDYLRPGCVPTRTFEQLICDFVTVSRCTSDYCSVGVCCGEINEKMAACDSNARLVNKATRTPGRNISKLKQFFDSNNVAFFAGGSNSSRTNSDVSSSHENNVSVVDSTPNDRCSENIKSPDPTNSVIPPGVLIDASSVSTFKTHSDSSFQSLQNSTSEVLFRGNSSSGGLWKNVNIGAKTENEGLWTSPNYESHHLNDNFESDSDVNQISNAFVASTAELNCLIASSRAELSKKKEPVLSDKSTLENYFTSFENSKPKNCVPLENVETSDANCNSSEFNNSFDCDIDEITFDDEDATYSDTSSDEELKNHPSAINTYLPSYALHTIIEESCEESERGSRGTTPTNNPSASKLERYFSWDIINDNEHNLQKKDDDESTIYSDSLSEGSGSANGDIMKEIDPIQLASSRLEKYFTSGLVGNENYFYPDDAEFLDDHPVSDFEEDSVHQKISRSALLNSLETKPSSDSQQQSKVDVVLSQQDVNEISEKEIACDNIQTDNDKNPENLTDKQNILSMEMLSTDCSLKEGTSDDELLKKDVISHELKPAAEPMDTSSSYELNANCDGIQNDIHNINAESCKQKQIVSKEQLASDVQAIIKKLLVYFSHSTSESFQEKTETDYVSAWQILETEIERLMQSISPTASLENNSCNNSTIDSNNSDYGSDTIESLDCMTDDDDNTDAKSRVNAKYPLSSFLNSTYKVPSEYDLRSFHISDETLSIWKRLIHSLQRDNSFIADDKTNDVNSEARLYIREQIITLMHTMTVNENSCIKELDRDVENKDSLPSPIQEKDFSNLNEAFNTCVNNNNILPHLFQSNITDKSTEQPEPSVEVLSVSSNENFPVDSTSSCSNTIPMSETSDEDILDSFTPESVDVPDLSVISNSNVFLTNSSHSIKFTGDKIAVDEVDLKHGNRISEAKLCSKDDLNFSVFVDIELGEEAASITQRKPSKKCSKKMSSEGVKTSSCHLWVEDESTEFDVKQSDIQEIPKASKKIFGKDHHQSISTIESIKEADTPKNTPSQNKSQRDTGYFSYKSSDDSLLNSSIPPGDFEVPNFKSLKRSVKKFPLTNTLSKSTNNINQTFSSVEAKFSTLQLKSHKTKVSMNPNSTSSRQFTSLFSPSAVFKRLTGSKSNDTTSPESSIPAKYLKKYARSSSIDNESMFGAISMPQLNCPKTGDSYSAIGLYSDNDKDSTITIDDEGYSKPFACSQSAISLGSHSASMTSVYSAAGCHYGYVTVSGDVLFGLNYNQKSQMMEVFVKQCRNLAAVDTRRNKSDPYVKVYLLPDKTKGGKRKTKTKKSTLSPVFNELLRFPVLKHELESRTLWLSVWNSDLFGRNDFLGEITLPLGYRLLDSPTLRWYPLQERMESLTSPLNYKGELFLALKYVPRDLSLESRFRPAPVISLRGALHVLVKEARKISGNRSNGTFDAFCKSYLLPDKSKSSKQKTPVVKKSRHPKWYYTMIYEDMSIEELKERSLELTIWDHDKITSNEFMGGVRLNTGLGLYHGVSVDWMDARRDESSLWNAMLESPNMWVDGCLPLRPTMQFRHS